MLLAVGSNGAAQSDDDIPKAGLSGDLLGERMVRKEREEARDSLAPPVPSLLGDIAEDVVDGDGTLLDDGSDRRHLGKSEKSPGGALNSNKYSPGDADAATSESDESPSDVDMATFAGKRENKNKKKKSRGKKKKRDRPKKKRRNGSKATRRKPRKRFAISGSKGRKQ